MKKINTEIGKKVFSFMLINIDSKLKRMRRRNVNTSFFKNKKFEKQHKVLEENMSDIQLIRHKMSNIVDHHNSFAYFMSKLSDKELKTKPVKFKQLNSKLMVPKVKIIDQS